MLFTSTIKNSRLQEATDINPKLNKAQAYSTEDLMYRHWDHWVTEIPRLDADSRVFQLLVWAMVAVTGQSRFFRYPLFFHLKLLELAGYTPNLSVCHRCGRPLTGPACFDPGRQEPGGAILVCQRCLPGPPKAALSLQSIRMAGYAQHSSLDSLHKLQAPSRCLVEALDLLHAYSQCLLQSDLHA